MLYQPVHLKSNIRHSCSFYLFDSRLWFFLKTHIQVRKCNFKIICAALVSFLAVSRPNLIIGYLGNFGACCANECIQNQIQVIFPVFLSLIVLFLWYFLKTYFRVRKNDFKIIFPPSLGSLTVSRFSFWVININSKIIFGFPWVLFQSSKRIW